MVKKHQIFVGRYISSILWADRLGIPVPTQGCIKDQKEMDDPEYCQQSSQYVVKIKTQSERLWNCGEYHKQSQYTS
ncbi:hypothetical protein [Acidithiobacillus thiooxidans]|uniref:hypothetical protein n=1 Tax=Acidithiobacillus thiooxidans TaxID=930 RepID=UPI001C0782B1|nr:hypothetical protein [Acidithiobacillus thiooxidans]